MTDSYVALDLETTGIGAKKEKITEIGMVKVLDGQIVSTYHSLVNPRRPIPEEIVRLTGIDDSMVQDAPGMEEILGEILAFMEELPRRSIRGSGWKRTESTRWPSAVR